ncbi:MAG: nucleoside kinase [Oligoflexia bacterium]|nr:nucleoside kinase [Oligoflexia bacterium]
MTAIKLSFEESDAVEVKQGTTLVEVLKLIKGAKEKDFVGALVNNKVTEMTKGVLENSQVRFLEATSRDGFRIYQRSALFILIRALDDVCPGVKAKILQSIANGLYVETIGGALSPAEIKKLEERMREIVDQDLPFTRKKVPTRQAIEYFRETGDDDKARLLSFKESDTTSLYELAGKTGYFFGYLAPSTGLIQRFSLRPYDDGILLQLPTATSPDKIVQPKKTKKLFEVLKEALRWRKILEVEDIGMLNEVIRAEKYVEVLHLAEALHEKKIAQVADLIAPEQTGVKVVLLAGPSASGKTTFTKRLAFQLRINGFRPVQVSMDDYFLDRDKTPRTPKGEHDFESPHAINIPLFKEHLAEMIQGKTVRLPHYDFKTGTSAPTGKVISPDDKCVILIEGIHGLNPAFSVGLPQDSIFKMYVSALTEVPLDNHNRIPTTDTRILRRILRDYQFRNYSPEDTIKRWPLVREGETQHIFRYQEEADVLFNTALIYELSAMKSLVEPLLLKVRPDSPAYSEALRLTKFLSYLLPIPPEKVPLHSILREFTGGGFFQD